MMKKTRPIGIFDSGVGGLTVVKEVMQALPGEDIVYFGDTARVPYGPKSQDTIIRFSIENILFLLRQNVKLIIIACNTSSSVALSIVERNFKVPIIGVINPGAAEAVRLTKKKRVGVIGTRTTIKSRAYEKQIQLLAPQVRVFSEACPLFVPLAEEGWLEKDVTRQIADEYLKPLKTKHIDTIVLGCTHYPLLKPVIRKVMGDEVKLVDSARQVAKKAKIILEQNGLLAAKGAKSKSRICFYVSDEPENFAKQGQKFLGFKLGNVRKVANV
ncbi:MAG: glutamate racemase [Candidatus Omnitrophica bacterium]|nr:glutamate racemase [Candidatus Omnitrophota bacterium]